MPTKYLTIDEGVVATGKAVLGHRSSPPVIESLKERASNPEQYPKPLEDCVYVIECLHHPRADGKVMVKIGWTKEVTGKRRLGSLQGASPFELNILTLWPGATRTDERSLHRKYSDQRERGEWFLVTQSERDAIVAEVERRRERHRETIPHHWSPT